MGCSSGSSWRVSLEMRVWHYQEQTSDQAEECLKGEPRIFLSGVLDIELFDVVAPTAEEWAAVR